MVLNVDYNYLGSSGMKVSNICLGALTFGTTDGIKLHRPGQLDPTGAYQLLDRFAECGGNFIDTADVYTARQSETIVGNWLSSKERSRYVIATKVRFNNNLKDPTDVNAVGLSRKHIVAGLEKSLECLQTNYVDLYQAHCWDSGTPIKETLLTFNDLQRAGKIHHIGVSNFCGWQLQKTVDLANHIGMSSILTLQQQYSLMERNAEFEDFQVCQNEGVSILPWSPLKGGFLSGKFKRTEAPSTETRIGYAALDEENRSLEIQPGWSALQSRDDVWLLLDAMTKIAQNHNKSVAQVAIRWLLQRKMVASIVIGAKTMNQLDDNIGASTGWELTCEEMETLNDLSAPVKRYPHCFIAKSNANRLK